MNETKKFCTDKIMLQLQYDLITDLIDVPCVRNTMLQTLNRGIPAWRELEIPTYLFGGSYTCKATYQVDTFLKRYTFEKDLYTSEQLEEKAIRDFKESQETFGFQRPLTLRTHLVVEHAKEILRKILGPFETDVFSGLCGWGKNAAVGLKKKEAYLDNRVEKLTATQKQAEWFSLHLESDPLLRSCVGEVKVVDSVKYTVVPKSYKALRGIAPDVSVGGYYSKAMGRYLQSRLEKGTPIRLANAQDQHKILAQQGSRTGKLVTIDKRKASDSFVREHMQMLLPEDWFEALELARVPNITVGGEKIVLRSYMLMGSGHTFPLQTLLFYALAKATSELLNAKGPVRVFGDDIIMPRSSANQYITVAQELGFSINGDKTYVDGPFRESCGGDYHNGLDVRPAMPEGTFERVPKRNYLSFLYRVTNSLLEKWDASQVPLAIGTLAREIRLHEPKGLLLGVKGVHGKDSCLLNELPNEDMVKPTIRVIDWVVYVEQLLLVPVVKRRKVRNEIPYLHQYLQGEESLFEFWTDTFPTLSTKVQENIIQKIKGTTFEPVYAPVATKGSSVRDEPQKGSVLRYARKKVRRPSLGYEL